MTDTFKAYFIEGFVSAIGLLVFCFGFVRMRKYQLIRDTPQSKIRSMAIGLVEVSGSVVPQERLTSPLSHTDCVYYRYTIQEYQESRDSDGKTVSSWVTIADVDKRVPFFIRDETGQVIVEPKSAEITLASKKVFFREASREGIVAGITKTFQHVTDTIHALQEGKKMEEILTAEISTEGLVLIEQKGLLRRNSRVGDREYTEYYIEPNALLYVLGSAANRGAETSELMIHKGENEPTFIISDKSEKGLLRRLLLETWLCFVFGGLFFTIGVMILLKTLNIFAP